jgi:cell fate regulator YaaT (PSP1 superfamily)
MEEQNNQKGANQTPAQGGGNRRRGHRGGRGRGHGHKGAQDRENRAQVVAEGTAVTSEKENKQAPRQKDSQNEGGEKNQNRAENAQSAQNGGNRRRGHRGGRGRGRGGHPEVLDAPAEQSAKTSTQNDKGPAQDFYISPTIHRASSGGDKWLDDTFSPLHEVEVHDPAAEEAARRRLDAEGPLLFREPCVVSEEQTPVDVTEVVGIRYKVPGKVYYFDPGQLKLKCGTYAIVETTRGPEYGEVVIANSMVSTDNIVPPLRPVIRAATEEDARHHAENKRKEDEAFRLCQQKVAAHGLDMKLVEAQYTFDNSKLLFYFTSDGRVDFRELVKDLASVFRTRIELRQIGIRDEAKLLGGLGVCGRPLCCAGFLSDFGQVSIKMAKEQNLSLNSTKISGVCGRLMCCLRYEHETYEQEIRLTPAVDSLVETRDGRGTVVSNHVLKGTVTVRLEGQEGEQPRTYHRDEVKLLHGKGPNKDADTQEAQN